MFGTQQFGTQTGATPQQYGYGTVAGYYPAQTDQWTSMFSMMMPMIMMIMMLAIMMPMFKGIAKTTES